MLITVLYVEIQARVKEKWFHFYACDSFPHTLFVCTSTSWKTPFICFLMVWSALLMAIADPPASKKASVLCPAMCTHRYYIHSQPPINLHASTTSFARVLCILISRLHFLRPTDVKLKGIKNRTLHLPHLSREKKTIRAQNCWDAKKWSTKKRWKDALTVRGGDNCLSFNAKKYGRN